MVQPDHWTGHEEKEYDPSDPEDLAEIRELFKEKLSKGWLAYAINEGKDPKAITKFDEDAERIILTADKVRIRHPSHGG